MVRKSFSDGLFTGKWCKPDIVIYRETSGGCWVYFTYSDGDRVRLDRGWSEDQIARGKAKLVDLDKTKMS